MNRHFDVAVGKYSAFGPKPRGVELTRSRREQPAEVRRLPFYPVGKEATMSGLRLTVVDGGPCRLEKSKIVAFAPKTVSIPTTIGIIEHPKHGLVLSRALPTEG